ncbi:lasso peptide biosynthesis B2 protein [Clostridium sp.]|uniref:lasso peptide biosynthesis B2 protein n=1 Tax=Clostridium sp. TaxID=1506 RepID=UPI003D6D043A
MTILYRLINKLKKFSKLSFRDQWLLIQVFILSGIVRFAILFLPFYKLARFAGKYKEESPQLLNDIEKVNMNKIAWAVWIVSRYTPWESKCFVKALTAQIMLKKRKVSTTLYLGVAKDEKNNPIAHAWLRSGTDIITGGSGYRSFTQVAKFATNIGGEKQ